MATRKILTAHYPTVLEAERAEVVLKALRRPYRRAYHSRQIACMDGFRPPGGFVLLQETEMEEAAS